VVAGLLMMLAACSGSADDSGTPTPSQASSSPTPTPSSGATLADGQPLPAGCPVAGAASEQTVAFVADGRAWALDPAGGDPTCVFPVSTPGPFSWNPRGDRALLEGLAIEGVDGTTLRTADTENVSTSSWGHPIGKAVVYISSSETDLLKVYPGSQRRDEITPVSDVRYLNVVYHPSGLAVAFIVDTGARQEIWLSSNVGEDPVRLVFGVGGTRFGSMDFSANGNFLYYGALHEDGSPILHAIDLRNPTTNLGLWRGEPGEQVLGVFASPARDSLQVAMTVGASCDDSRAVVTEPGQDEQQLPLEKGTPSRVVGWLGDHTVLAAQGGCVSPLSLSSADLGSSAVVPLVAGVDLAAVRRPLSGFVPSLPTTIKQEVGSGVG
jgi:hypothetical protein